MNKKIIVTTTLIAILVIGVILFAYYKKDAPSSPVSSTPILQLPNSKGSGFGTINEGTCYIDENDKLVLSNGTNQQLVPLEFENARVLSNGKSCLVDMIEGTGFKSILVTENMETISFKNTDTRAAIRSGYYQICQMEKCKLIDSLGNVVASFSSSESFNTPPVDNSYFFISGYSPQYIDGKLIYVSGNTKKELLDIDQPVISLVNNGSLAVISLEQNQYGTSIVVNADTDVKQAISAADPNSFTPYKDGFIYASKTSDIAEANKSNGIYFVDSSGRTQPVMASDEKNTYNINNLIYSQGKLYWQDDGKILSTEINI